jgi:CHAT domain-containing protein
MAERTGRPSLLTRTLNQLAYAHIFLNAPHRAIPVFERAARVAKEFDDPEAEINSYSGLSRAYRKLRKYELALEGGLKAAELLEAAIAWKTTESAPSEARVRPRIVHPERLYAHTQLELGKTYRHLTQWRSAGVAFEKALEAAKRISARHLIARAFRELGTVARDQGELKVATSYFENALLFSSRPGFQANTLGKLGRVYRKTGRLSEAEVILRRAVAGIEDIRSTIESEELRESYVEDKLDAYRNLIHVLFDQGKLVEAFDMSERARARAFLDLLGNRVTLSRGRSQSLIAEERELRERISALNALPEDAPALRQELELAREAYQAFLQRVRQMDREQASLMTVEPLTLAKVQELLPTDTVLLEYFVGGGRTLLWVVSHDTMRAVRLRIGRDELVRQVSELRELIASSGRAVELQQAAQNLYRTLVAPAFPVGFPRELLIVPHGVLHYLPFQALMPAPGRYLIQETPLYYYSSASLIHFTREKQRALGTGVFVVVNPELENPTMNLRYAEREARELQRLFPGATVLLRQDATEERARTHLGQHAVAHLATHADLEEEDPLGSALLLRPGGADDGRLEVQEIFGLDLQASLVVLSACETALGRLGKGDELTGLTRAFIYAGTPSIITTLWKVNDRASYELMREFYRNLKAGRDKAEALRQAQLTTLERYPHPYYWAAYQLTGEAR